VTDNGDIQVADLKAERVFNTVPKSQWGLACVALSHDSKRIACGFNDGSVSIIDALSGELIKQLWQKSTSSGKRKPIVWVAFAGVENVISICQSGRLYVWAFTRSYDFFRKKPGENKIIVASSRYSKVIAATWGGDIHVCVHDGQPAKGRYALLGTIESSSSPIVFMDLSASGSCLLLCRAAGQCEIWQIKETPVLSVTFSHSSQPRFSITISPDNMQVAFGTERGSIQTTDITEAILVDSLRGHSKRAMLVNISDDGTKVASICKRCALGQHGDDGQFVVIWDLETKSVARVLHVGGKGIYDAVFSHDSQRLAVIFDNGVTTIWRVHTGDLITTIGSPLLKGGTVRSAAVSHDLTRIAIVDYHGFEHNERFRVYTGGGRFWTLPEKALQTNPCCITPDSICFLNDGTRIAISYSFKIEIYEIGETGIEHCFDISEPFYDNSVHRYISHDLKFRSFLKILLPGEDNTVQKPGDSYSRIPRLVASTDSGSLADFSSNGNTCFYSLREGDRINKSSFSKDTPLTGRVACISPSWQFFAVISPEHGVNIWDVSTRKEISFLNTNKAKAKAIMISSDSKDLFILTEKELFVYDTVHLQVPTTVLSLPVPVRSLQVSSQLGRGILALADNTIQIWDYRKVCII
jgi:WD40 repeat protein